MKYHGEAVAAAEETTVPPPCQQQQQPVKVEANLQTSAAATAVIKTASAATANGVAAASAVASAQEENGGCNGTTAQATNSGSCITACGNNSGHAPLKLCLSVRTVRVSFARLLFLASNPGYVCIAIICDCLNWQKQPSN